MKSEPIKALLIEDDPDDTLLLMELLARSGWPSFNFTLVCAEDLKSGLQLLAEGGIEVVLLDLMLPDSQGIETVRKMRAQAPNIPIVVLTGLRDEAMGLEALAHGAQDYQIKGSIEEHAFKRTISYAVERHRLLMEVRRVEQLKAEIKERRRLDSLKDQLMSTVSHEMRTPLSVIKAAVDNLEEGLAGPLSEQQAMLVVLAHNNVKRLLRVVNNILDLSRLESGRSEIRRQRLDLAALIRETLRGLRLAKADKNVAIEEELPAGLPSVYADPDLVVELINNLIDNALRFTKTKVVIRLKESESPLSHEGGGAAVLTARKCLQVRVEDDGPGIPRERIPELFNKFVQVNRSMGKEGYKGTGLGLAICKEIVERQDGRIWVESGEGAGARFFFDLPQFEAEPAGGGAYAP